MGVGYRLGPLLSACIALALGSSAAAQGADLPIHSDLPLFTDPDSLWPRSYRDVDSFGCTNRVRTGDWRIVRPGEEEP